MISNYFFFRFLFSIDVYNTKKYWIIWLLLVKWMNHHLPFVKIIFLVHDIFVTYDRNAFLARCIVPFYQYPFFRCDSISRGVKMSKEGVNRTWLNWLNWLNWLIWLSHLCPNFWCLFSFFLNITLFRDLAHLQISNYFSGWANINVTH